MGLAPTAEGVAVAYLDTLVSVPVATTLPALSSWGTITGSILGFVIMPTVVGGSGRDTPLRVPVLQVETWAAAPDSDSPQWGAANGLAEDIAAAVWNEAARPALVRQRANYDQALVQSMSMPSEPRRLPDPDTGRARFVMEIILAWTRVLP